MVKMTLTKTKQTMEDYRPYTDKYFLRSNDILKAENINPLVRYQIFARTRGLVRGVDEAVDFIRDEVGDKAKIYALKDGNTFQGKEPLIKIDIRVQDIIELETVYLGMISGALTGEIDMQQVREKAREIYEAAQEKPVLYFGARHFDWSLDEQIAGICQEEGFVGCSTDVGARAWNAKGGGTTPHALILSYTAYMDENGIEGNPTVEAAKGFDKHIDPKVPRVILIDTFNREITDTLETAEALGDHFSGVRIDTCGENYAQGTHPGDDEDCGAYENPRGVSIAAVRGLRNAMVDNGLENKGLVVSSGFNEKKTKAFIKADKEFQERYGVPLFTAIGTGSIAQPKMATSDVVAYFNEKDGKWKPMSKVGRQETLTDRLEEIK